MKNGILIPVTNGRKDNGFAIVSPQDVEKVLGYKWHLNSKGYVRAALTKKRQVFMHRLILGLPKNRPWVDHINRNPKDNRRSNLRIADGTLNNFNKGLQKNNRSGYCGVYLKRKKVGGKMYVYWVAALSVKGKTRERCFRKKSDAIREREKMYVSVL